MLPFTENTENQITSVIFAELFKEFNEWQFKAIGEGKIADLNGILGLYM